MAKFTYDDVDSTYPSDNKAQGKQSSQTGNNSERQNQRDRKQDKHETVNGEFSFSFDTETGEIIVTYPDGIRTERLKSIRGPKGESTFELWCKQKGIKGPNAQDLADFLESLKGKDGLTIKGVDAPTPYEEWRGRQPKNASEEDLSYDAFLKSITGPNGKDGYEGKDGKSAYEIWKTLQPADVDTSVEAFFASLKGKPGENGHEGKDGENGHTWKPYLKDGKLYFENTTTGERTDVFDITGPQGPGGFNGKDGDVWKPFFTTDSHQLYFKNQHGDTIGPFDVVGATGKQGEQGPRGESAYQIWLNEGHCGDYHDFLLWMSKQADKGENGEDGDTYVPHVEKGHLFFISKKTGQRIDGGSVIGPEGPQGEAGLNGHNVTHKYSYKEIKDWTCPVQEINPHLIVSSDDLASGSSAEAHMRETLNRINNIRREGRNLKGKEWINKSGEKKTLPYWICNPLKSFFWWCSGADVDLLRMCPAEHSKYMGIGTVIFFTALMAMVSSFFAISYVFGNPELSTSHDKFGVCVVFAIFWGLMIFFLDRFITNTMYSDGKVTISWLELRSALPRILISIFLGIVISAPLELEIFKKEVNTQVTSMLENEANRKEDEFRNRAKAQFEEKISDITRRSDYIKKQYQLAENQIKSINDVRPPVPIIGENPQRTDEYGNLVGGGKYTVNATDIINHNAKQQQQIDSLNIVLDSCRKSMEGLSKEISTIEETRNTDIKSKVDTLKNQLKLDNAAGLFMRLKALHEIAFDEKKEGGYKPWTWVNTNWGWITALVFVLLCLVSFPFLMNVIAPEYDENGNEKPVAHRKVKGGLVLYPWFAVVAFICGYCSNTLFNALPYYIFSAVGMIMMLFILIDVSPVFYKMMLADGQYEQYHHKEKAITQDLIRLNFAQSIAKVNESEIGRLAPLVFSKPFEKLKLILKKSDKHKKDELGWIQLDEDGNEIKTARQNISNTNSELFETVLGMKQAIIEASYQAWYRDMRDAVMGMHKPGFGNGESGNEEENDNNPPSNPPSPSSSAERETGHHSADDEPFDRDNYYGERTGTSPNYDASSDDPYPGTPEDILKEEDRNLGSQTDPGIESDEQSQEVDGETISANKDDVDELSQKNNE